MSAQDHNLHRHPRPPDVHHRSTMNSSLPTTIPAPDIPLPDPALPNWPRRVSKACCSCRRDKIRCDGARPCAGCLKKGFSPDKCIDGCLPCRRARARCEGGMPCTRCRDMSVSCVDEGTTPPPKPDPAYKTPSKGPRGRTIERAKLACQACRRDNKKCDDQRPCTRCQARAEDCIHVARGPKVVKLRCKGCRRENRKCEDQRPCKFCAETGEQCADVPRKGRGHGTRVKTACVNCRRDKIQCGTERPCKGCARRGLECVDRTCQCAEKGTGQECAICRSQRGSKGMGSGVGVGSGEGEGSGSPMSDHDDAEGDDEVANAAHVGGTSQSANGSFNAAAHHRPAHVLPQPHAQQQQQHSMQYHPQQPPQPSHHPHAHLPQGPPPPPPHAQHHHPHPHALHGGAPQGYGVHHGYPMQSMLGAFPPDIAPPHGPGPMGVGVGVGVGHRVMYGQHHPGQVHAQHAHQQQHVAHAANGVGVGAGGTRQHVYYPVIDPSIDDAPRT